MIKPTALLPVSALMITNRADHRFEQALSSIEWAAEIIIADYDSGANWTELKKQYPLKVIKHDTKKITDFATARNVLIEQAAQPWILFIDSDEILQPFTADTLLELLHNKSVAGYTLHRADIFLGQTLRYGEVKNVNLLRLARKEKIRYHRTVHEEVTLQGRVATSPLLLLHHSHESIAQFLTAITHYSYLEAQSRPLPSVLKLLFETLFFPSGKFLANILIHSAWRDGWRGIVYAVMMSVHSLSVRLFLFERYGQSK